MCQPAGLDGEVDGRYQQGTASWPSTFSLMQGWPLLTCHIVATHATAFAQVLDCRSTLRSAQGTFDLGHVQPLQRGLKVLTFVVS